MNELAQIMKDLSVLVIDQVYERFSKRNNKVLDVACAHSACICAPNLLITLNYLLEQGTIIDRIDYNVQSVAASVEEGYKQLQKVLPPTSPSCSMCTLSTHTHTGMRLFSHSVVFGNQLPFTYNIDCYSL